MKDRQTLAELRIRLARALGAQRCAERAERRMVGDLEAWVAERTADLEASEARNRGFYHESPDMHMSVDLTNDTIVQCNETFAATVGSEPPALVGRQLLDFAAPGARGDLDRLLHQLRVGGRVRGASCRLVDRDGTVLEGSVTATCARDERGTKHGRLIVRDVTERRRLEQQLLQSQKLEGFGRLAGAVAHDFNNVLTPILGFSDLILSQLSPKLPIGRDVHEIRRAAQQGVHLTEQLLVFSRRNPRAVEAVNVNDIARGSCNLLRQLVGEDIVIRPTLDNDVWPILADASHVEQLMMNLTVNARDAMPDGGVVTLQTGTRQLPRSTVLSSTTVPAGDYVVLSVGDTGCGMSPHVVAQIFDPFFTTKDVGKGTGLGLATVYGITRQHGGYIDVRSAPGQGTVITMYFPRAAGNAAGPRPEECAVAASVGHERGLVVEDDGAVRGFVTAVLGRHGYQVLEAPGSAEALRIVGDEPAPIDLVLTDVVMPGLNGIEMVAKLPPRVVSKTLFMSGNAPRLRATSTFALPRGATLLEKPFSSKTLLQTVRRILDDAPAQTSE